MEPVLRVEHICKRFGDQTVLNDVSAEIKRGEIYGLLGPNGAGKTTLLRIINRITTPDSGSVFFYGRPLSPADVARIGYMPEERGLYKGMKVAEQAIYFARLKGMSSNDATRELKMWFAKFGIEGWWNKSVAELSKGMAQKVQFITTVLHKPELLIFDEPFSGFDPVNADLFKQEIQRLSEEGTTIILSTHDMTSVEEMCEHITLLDKSRVVMSGRIEDIRHQHGTDVYELRFKGNERRLLTAMTPLATVLQCEEGFGESKLRFRVSDKNALRPVIARINDEVDIVSLSEVVPNMNDIFISAVTEQQNG